MISSRSIVLDRALRHLAVSGFGRALDQHHAPRVLDGLEAEAILEHPERMTPTVRFPACRATDQNSASMLCAR
jgi:hypothetical protein